jgi:hypothetical protein
MIKLFLKKSFFSMTLVLAQLTWASKPDSYLLPVTRSGKKEMRVARNFWSGEYPSPVIDVNSKDAKGFTKIKAYSSLRNQDKPVDCLIQNGLYHPWAKGNESAVEYYQIVPNREYIAKKEITTDSLRLKTGEKLSREVYLSEGQCEGVVIKNRKEKRVEYGCDETKIEGLVQISGANDKFSEQWIHLKCKGSKNAFVQDLELLKQPGIKQGEIENYEKIKGAGD